MGGRQELRGTSRNGKGKKKPKTKTGETRTSTSSLWEDELGDGENFFLCGGEPIN